MGSMLKMRFSDFCHKLTNAGLIPTLCVVFYYYNSNFLPKSSCCAVKDAAQSGNETPHFLRENQKTNSAVY